MAKPNFGFHKRQKELERKKKQEEKLLRRQERGAQVAGEERNSELAVPEEETLGDE